MQATKEVKKNSRECVKGARRAGCAKYPTTLKDTLQSLTS